MPVKAGHLSTGHLSLALPALGLSAEHRDMSVCEVASIAFARQAMRYFEGLTGPQNGTVTPPKIDSLHVALARKGFERQSSDVVAPAARADVSSASEIASTIRPGTCCGIASPILRAR